MSGYRRIDAAGGAMLGPDGRLAANEIPLVGAGLLVEGSSGVHRYTRTPGGPLAAWLVTANNHGTCSIVAFDRLTPIDRIGVNVTIAGEAGSLIRLLIHGPIPASRSLIGGATPLVLNAGTVPGDGATGFKEITIDVDLVPGAYTLSAVVQNAPTTRPTVSALTSGTHGNPYASFTAAAITAAYNGYTQSDYTVFTSPPRNGGQTLNAAAVFLRVAGV